MRGSPRALRKRTVLEKPPALDQLAAAVPAKRADEVIETPNIIRPDTLGSCGRREVHRTPAFIGPRPDANIDDGAVREDLKDTVSRVEHHGNIRIVVKVPQSRGKAFRNELQAWPGRIEDR